MRETRDGAEALEALRDWPADLAIVDFQMFPVDGVEFTRMVRNAPDSASNPLSAHHHDDRPFGALPRGATPATPASTEFVAKPLTAKAVLERMQAVIYHPPPVRAHDGLFRPRPPATGRSRVLSDHWRRSTDQDREAKAKKASAAGQVKKPQWDQA